MRREDTFCRKGSSRGSKGIEDQRENLWIKRVKEKLVNKKSQSKRGVDRKGQNNKARDSAE